MLTRRRFSGLLAQGLAGVALSQAEMRLASPRRTFQNPLLPSGPDPWITYHEGFYYYTHTLGDRIDLWKTRNPVDLAHAERRTIWRPPATGPYSKQIWAPEIHRLCGKWYVYFAADDGRNENHRLWVLESGASDPLDGTWELKGKVTDPDDRWAIDGTVFEHRGQLYLVWSGWEGAVNGQQNLYIARLKDPWTVDGRRVKISEPTYDWERVGEVENWRERGEPPRIFVNEGPEALRRGERIFIIYSASACWTDQYCLGMLMTSTEANLLDPRSWKKHPAPVFRQSPKNGVYAPGHNSFFKSPDGREDWILYHANSAPGQGCGNRRAPRAQPFGWSREGLPEFGEPLPTQVRLPVPSGVEG
jgi:GH43 family beta-xylosidase